MQQSKRQFIGLCGTVVTSTALAGCLGDDDEEADADSTPSPEETPTATPEETPTATPEPEAAFDVRELSLEAAVIAGEDSLETTAVVENTGDADGVASVEFSLDVLSVTEESDEMSPGDSMPVTVELDAETLDRNRYDLTATVDDSSASTPVDVFGELDQPGVYGSVMSAADASLTDGIISMDALDGEVNEFDIMSVDNAGQFQIPHLVDPEYELFLTFEKAELGVFDGVPPVTSLEYATEITDEIEMLGRYEIPQAYRTEVQLVDADGNPVGDFTPINFRGPDGIGTGPHQFTTDDDGYVIATDGTETGISVPEEEDGGLQVEARLDTDERPIEEFGMIYGSPEGEEFTFEIDDPERFHEPDM